MEYRTVPLFNQSNVFVGRLMSAATDFKETRYYYFRRINWSHRYCDGFYRSELELFQRSPNEYLEECSLPRPALEDVMEKKLSSMQVLSVILKVFAHWIFFLIGSLMNKRIISSKTLVYRKAWVDDIELAFNPDTVSVVRAVYPFPINFRRQLRYLKFILEKKYLFKLDGNPYIPLDVLTFVFRRNIKALSRMEARANIKHAMLIKKLGVLSVELSDEFDLGSLDCCRMLTKLKLTVTNSAHGVGKYLPVHGYQNFKVITNRQAEYYIPIKNCKYMLRQLNDKTESFSKSEKSSYRPPQSAVIDSASQTVHFVFLSQVFKGSGDVIADNEKSTLRRLSAHFSKEPNLKLLYKKHPNNNLTIVPDSFQSFDSKSYLGGLENLIFASFYSTCQIDPSFVGEKVLLRSNLLYPEIVFDSSEKILSLDELIAMLETRLKKAIQRN